MGVDRWGTESPPPLFTAGGQHRNCPPTCLPKQRETHLWLAIVRLSTLFLRPFFSDPILVKNMIGSQGSAPDPVEGLTTPPCSDALPAATSRRFHPMITFYQRSTPLVLYYNNMCPINGTTALPTKVRLQCKTTLYCMPISYSVRPL